jgi:hypothetical protein
MVNQIFQPQFLARDAEQRVVEVLFATQAGFVCALHADDVLAPERQLGGIPSVCTSDCVVSLSEVHSKCGGGGGSAIVRDPVILFADIAERLLSVAAAASGASWLPFSRLHCCNK